MAQRWKALSEGRQDATLLSAPYNITAEAAGFTNLGRAVDSLGAYQGNVAAVRKGWSTENGPHMVAFIRAYRASISWLSHGYISRPIMAKRLISGDGIYPIFLRTRRKGPIMNS